MERYKYASIGKRAVSFTIDDILVSLLFIAIFYNQIISLKTQELMINFIIENSGILLMLRVIYHTFFIGYNGATLGKYIVKIRAVDEQTGNLLPWSRAFLRAIVRTIGESLLYFTFIFAFFDKRVQTLHDKISKCVVVEDVKN